MTSLRVILWFGPPQSKILATPTVFDTVLHEKTMIDVHLDFEVQKIWQLLVFNAGSLYDANVNFGNLSCSK